MTTDIAVRFYGVFFTTPLRPTATTTHMFLLAFRLTKVSLFRMLSWLSVLVGILSFVSLLSQIVRCVECVTHRHSGWRGSQKALMKW